MNKGRARELLPDPYSCWEFLIFIASPFLYVCLLTFKRHQKSLTARCYGMATTHRMDLIPDNDILFLDSQTQAKPKHKCANVYSVRIIVFS